MALTVWDASALFSGAAIDGANAQIASVVKDSTNGSHVGLRATHVHTVGKRYFELQLLAGAKMYAGFGAFTPFNPNDPDGSLNDTAGTLAVLFWGGVVYAWTDGSLDVLDAGITLPDGVNGKRLQVAVDVGAATVQFGVDNVWGGVLAIPGIAGKKITPFLVQPDFSTTPRQVRLYTETATITGTPPTGFTVFDTGAVAGTPPAPAPTPLPPMATTILPNSIGWPTFMPQAPAKYSEQKQTTSIRTQPSSGPAKSRRRFTKAVTKGSVSYTLSNWQAMMFDDFWTVYMLQGAVKVTFTHPWNGKLIAISIPEAPSFTDDGPLNVSVSFGVEYL